MQPIILASSSPYRRQLLSRLGLPFESANPAIDETRFPSEQAQTLVKRLSEAKAQALRSAHPEALIIGSDQVAEHQGEILCKPGSRERAIAQLTATSGQRVSFHTGISLLNAKSGMLQTEAPTYTVHFRPLTRQQIERYVDAEQPFDCAGSFKMEGLGISLFEKLEGDDPNTLIGLPLIRLVAMLAREGIAVP